MDKKATEFLDTYYTRLKPNHNFKRTGKKPVLYIFYILYPISQNGMGKVTVFYNGTAFIEFMKNDKITKKSILFVHYIQHAIVTFEEGKEHVSPIWYRRVSIVGNSGLTKKLGGKSHRVSRTTLL